MTDPEPARTRAIIEDPGGRPVRLVEERWAHIASRHPELSSMEAAVLRAVHAPSRHLPGRRPDEEWFYLELEPPRPTRWLKVVVSYRGQEGWIVTAFLRRSLP